MAKLTMGERENALLNHLTSVVNESIRLGVKYITDDRTVANPIVELTSMYDAETHDKALGIRINEDALFTFVLDKVYTALKKDKLFYHHVRMYVGEKGVDYRLAMRSETRADGYKEVTK